MRRVYGRTDGWEWICRRGKGQFNKQLGRMRYAYARGKGGKRYDGDRDRINTTATTTKDEETKRRKDELAYAKMTATY